MRYVLLLSTLFSLSSIGQVYPEQASEGYRKQVCKDARDSVEKEITEMERGYTAEELVSDSEYQGHKETVENYKNGDACLRVKIRESLTTAWKREWTESDRYIKCCNQTAKLDSNGNIEYWTYKDYYLFGEACSEQSC